MADSRRSHPAFSGIRGFTVGRAGGEQGFTIIELLVVVSIIALLTSVTLALLSNSRARSRDVRREKDVKVLQDGLSLYATNGGVYPTTDATGIYLTGSDAVSTALLGAGALTGVPLDPSNTANYRYHYLSTDGFTYLITHYLETDSIPGKSSGQQQVGP